jgi:hypothetical protein
MSNTGYKAAHHLHFAFQNSNALEQGGYGESIQRNFSDISVCNPIYNGVPKYINPDTQVRQSFISDNKTL